MRKVIITHKWNIEKKGKYILNLLILVLQDNIEKNIHWLY